MGKMKYGKAGRGFLAAVLVSGLAWGNPAWAGILENMGQRNQAAWEERAATPCNGEKEEGEKSAGERMGELYMSATEIMLPEPYRIGYEFLGWNTEPDGSGELYMAGDVIEIAEMTLYAVWDKEAEDITHREIATVSNAGRATASNAEKAERTEEEKAAEKMENLGHGQGTEPTDNMDAKAREISGIKRATESNAGKKEVSEAKYESETVEGEGQISDSEPEEAGDPYGMR